MSKFSKPLFLSLVPIAMLAMVTEVQAQATDVDCVKCIDAGDIAKGAVNTTKLDDSAVNTNKLANQAVDTSKLAKNAVTSAKIANGAVTLSKVVPKLKNSIGTYCQPGTVVVGKDNSGNFVCEAASPQPGSADWVAYDFVTAGSNIVNDCLGGPKFVKQSDYDANLYVGATLCHPGRYKLFLADDPTGFYWEMSDGDGNGNDHCQMIGGTNATDIATAETSQSLPGGYRRSDLDEDFVFDSSLAPGWWRAAWYECGIEIPSAIVFPGDEV